MNKLPPVSALINEADDTAAAEMRNEHASADAKSTKTAGVEYIGDNVVSTEEPAKINDIIFFGIVRGW